MSDRTTRFIEGSLNIVVVPLYVLWCGISGLWNIFTDALLDARGRAVKAIGAIIFFGVVSYVIKLLS